MQGGFFSSWMNRTVRDETRSEVSTTDSKKSLKKRGRRAGAREGKKKDKDKDKDKDSSSNSGSRPKILKIDGGAAANLEELETGSERGQRKILSS